MIWATVSSQSCFCWLYRASPSLAAKNRKNLILVLTIWWCTCVVFSCVVERGCLLWPVPSLGKNSISLCPALFRIPRPNLPVTPGVSWLPTFALKLKSRGFKAAEAVLLTSKQTCNELPMARSTWQGLRTTSGSWVCQPRPIKTMGTSVLQPQGVEFWQ